MEQEGIIRLSIFFGLFFVFAATEYIFPRRMVTKSKARRWITNWSVSCTFGDHHAGEYIFWCCKNEKQPEEYR